MKITWLGQGGLWMEKEGFSLMIDPYLSNAVAKIQPKNYRRVPVDPQFFSKKPDMLLITHDHADHLDPETLVHFLDTEKELTVLCSALGFAHLRSLGWSHNYVRMTPGTVWSTGGLRITATRAEHSEESAIGYLIEDEEITYYISGDTLYHYGVAESVRTLSRGRIDYAFLPINGLGNNMNKEDAARFAADIGAKCVIPMHVGLFDSITAEDLPFATKVIPQFYQEIPLKR